MEHTDSYRKGGWRGIMVEGRGRDWSKNMNDPWTWTTVVWGGTVGARGGLGGGGQKGKNWDNCN